MRRTSLALASCKWSGWWWRVQGALPRKGSAAAAGEERKALVEPRREIGDAHHLDASGGELDRERYTVETPADVADDRHVVVGEPERFIDERRTVDEQRDGAESEGVAGVQLRRPFRNRER